MSFSSVEFTRAPEVSAEFAGRVRSLLRASALGDALGYPLELLSAEQIAERAPKPWDSAFGELLVSDDTQLTCFTLDALTEVLEWNNEGAAADELACLWLAYLRWFRGIGEVLPESAPFSLDREIDGSSELTARRGPGAATLRALGSGEMQLVSKSLNPDALGSGALVRSAALGVLPVAQERTVVLLAVRAAALTHGHPEALASAAAYALLVRDLLASPAGSFDALLDSARRVLDWCGTVAADDSIPGDASRTAGALGRGLRVRLGRRGGIHAGARFRGGGRVHGGGWIRGGLGLRRRVVDRHPVQEARVAAADGVTFPTPDWAAALDADEDFVAEHLSDLEAHILAHYASGESSASVARALSVSKNTVNTYIARIRDKYRESGRPAESRVDLFRRAAEDGLVSYYD